MSTEDRQKYTILKSNQSWEPVKAKLPHPGIAVVINPQFPSFLLLLGHVTKKDVSQFLGDFAFEYSTGMREDLPFHMPL